MASQQQSPTPMPEWLPAGWTVEIKVRKNGKQDKFYVEPSGALKFNSKPEVFRYLNSLESAKSKSKEMSTDSGKRSTRTSLLAAAEAQKLAESGTKGQNSKNRGSKLSTVKKDEGKGDSTPVKDDTSEQRLEVAEEKSGGSTLVENLPEKLPHESGEKRSGKRKSQQSGIRKSHDKTDPDTDTPRRASKRLAGIKADPEAELVQVNNQAHLVAANNNSSSSEEAKGSTEKVVFENLKNTAEERKADEKPTTAHLPEENVRKIENDSNTIDKPINPPPVHIPTNPSNPEEHVRKIEDDCKTNENVRKIEDDCKTNENVRKIEDDCKTNENVRKIEDDCKTNENVRKIEDDCKTNENVRKIEDDCKTNENVRKIENENECKTSEKPGSPAPLNLSSSKDTWMDPSSFDLAIGDGDNSKKANNNDNNNPPNCEDLWTDPCIEFAIKTLTGAIPLEEELKVAGDNNSKSQGSGWPFGDSWKVDPCIEFAVKTLRGDIPVVGVQDSYHGQAGSSDKNDASASASAAAAAAASGGNNVGLQSSGNGSGGGGGGVQLENCSRGGRVQ